MDAGLYGVAGVPRLPSPIAMRRVLVLLAWSLAPGLALAQVEWFTKERPGESGYRFASFLYTDAQAQGSHPPSHQQSCTSADANLPQPKTAYHKQFDKCGKPVRLEQGGTARFEGIDRAIAATTIPNPAQRVVLTATAQQEAVFGKRSLTVHASVDTKTTDPSKRHNRGLPTVFGEVYFRVPDGAAVPFTFDATMGWEGKVIGNRGGFQLSWVPNTMTTNHPRESFNSGTIDFRHPSGGTYKHTGSLGPGVYVLQWGVSNDVSGADSSVTLNMTLSLDVKCEAPISKASFASMSSSKTGLYGPITGIDAAAKSAEPFLRALTDSERDKVEYGTLIMRDLRAKDRYYFTLPVKGTSLEVSGQAYDRSLKAAFDKSCEALRNFALAATAHTHPPGDFSNDFGRQFSDGDFNQAIDKLSSPYFDRIYLFRPDGCISSFKAQASDQPIGITGRLSHAYRDYVGRTKLVVGRTKLVHCPK